MRELSYVPMLAFTESTRTTPHFPESPATLAFATVQPFPTVEVGDRHELVVPPREYRTLVEHPA